MNLEPMCTNQGFASLVPKPETDPYFLLYLVELLRPCLIRLGAGTTFLEVSRREVRRVKCRVPKQRLEQEQISAVIRAADEALALTSDAPLQQLRKSLLYELMTGRVKVGSKA
jgi:type I restriction enzyme S subunit